MHKVVQHARCQHEHEWPNLRRLMGVVVTAPPQKLLLLQRTFLRCTGLLCLSAWWPFRLLASCHRPICATVRTAAAGGCLGAPCSPKARLLHGHACTATGAQGPAMHDLDGDVDRGALEKSDEGIAFQITRLFIPVY